MNTSATDTLAYNIDLVNTWQADPSYYYNRELLTPDINIMEWLSRQIGKLLQELFGSRVMSEYGEVILIVLVVLLLLFLVWFIYKNVLHYFFVHILRQIFRMRFRKIQYMALILKRLYRMR